MGVEYCEHARGIWFDTVDDVQATPMSVKRQIRDHNATVDRLCGG